MAMATLTDYKAELASPGQIVPFLKTASGALAGRVWDLWTTPVDAGTAPTTAAAPNRATVGALGQQNGGTLTLRCVGGEVSSSGGGMLFLCDRLSHQGGLSGIVTTAQTTNLPTAALTRYTAGDGVMAMLSIYTTIGVTGTTVTASYTNQAGTAGQTTPAVTFGGTGAREANRGVLLPLAAGDTGVRAVASVTVLATTGTAGAFGVTLFRPLVALNIDRAGGQYPFSLVDSGMLGGLPEILDDACLFWLAVPANTLLSAQGAVFLAED